MHPGEAGLPSLVRLFKGTDGRQVLSPWSCEPTAPRAGSGAREPWCSRETAQTAHATKNQDPLLRRGKKHRLTSIGKTCQHDAAASPGGHQKPSLYHGQDGEALGRGDHVGCRRKRQCVGECEADTAAGASGAGGTSGDGEAGRKSATTQTGCLPPRLSLCRKC